MRLLPALRIASGSNPGKAVHLYATADIPDLTKFRVGVANNGGGTDGAEITLPSGSASAGDNVILVRNSLTPLVTHLCAARFQKQLARKTYALPLPRVYAIFWSPPEVSLDLLLSSALDPSYKC